MELKQLQKVKKVFDKMLLDKHNELKENHFIGHINLIEDKNILDTTNYDDFHIGFTGRVSLEEGKEYLEFNSPNLKDYVNINGDVIKTTPLLNFYTQGFLIGKNTKKLVEQAIVTQERILTRTNPYSIAYNYIKPLSIFIENPTSFLYKKNMVYLPNLLVTPDLFSKLKSDINKEIDQKLFKKLYSEYKEIKELGKNTELLIYLKDYPKAKLYYYNHHKEYTRRWAISQKLYLADLSLAFSGPQLVSSIENKIKTALAQLEEITVKDYLIR